MGSGRNHGRSRRTKGAEQLGREVFTVPNALSLLRLFMVPVVVVLLLGGRDLAAVVVFVLAALTDFLDGRIARRSGPTVVGKFLDPLADRLMLSSTAVVLAVRGLLPAWAVAILVGRDLLALVGGLALRGRMRVNPTGKAATAVLMVAVAVVIFVPGRIGEVLFYVGFALSLLAGVLYVVGLVRRPGGAGDAP